MVARFRHGCVVSRVQCCGIRGREQRKGARATRRALSAKRWDDFVGSSLLGLVAHTRITSIGNGCEGWMCVQGYNAQRHGRMRLPIERMMPGFVVDPTQSITIWSNSVRLLFVPRRSNHVSPEGIWLNPDGGNEDARASELFIDGPQPRWRELW